jgi:hypothetical protein
MLATYIIWIVAQKVEQAARERVAVEQVDLYVGQVAYVECDYRLGKGVSGQRSALLLTHYPHMLTDSWRPGDLW